MELVRNIGCYGAVLYQVPNSPITFADEGFAEERREDAIIAKTWQLYL